MIGITLQKKSDEELVESMFKLDDKAVALKEHIEAGINLSLLKTAWYEVVL